jgi:hypothetical protein
MVLRAFGQSSPVHAARKFLKEKRARHFASISSENSRATCPIIKLAASALMRKALADGDLLATALELARQRRAVKRPL